MTSVGDNIRVQNKNPNSFIYFLIGDTPLFSMSNRSTLIQDNSLHGLDCMNNNIDNVSLLNCYNASITILSALNASFFNCYIDPAIIDNCCFTQNVCMNNCSIVNLDISKNVSFGSLHNLNSSFQNISLSYWNISHANSSSTEWNTIS